MILLNVKWSYGGRPYGYEKSWWDNQFFKDYMIKNWAPESGGKAEMFTSIGEKVMVDYTSYDSVIDYMNNIVYEFVLYKVNGNWYAYPEGRLIKQREPVSKPWVINNY